MGDVETGHFRGEGGGIYEMSLPLPKVMQQKVTKGYLTRVNPDGSPYTEPAVDDGQGNGDAPPADPMKPPSPSALKAEWVGYVVRVHGLTPDDAEAVTKQDLIDKYGKPPESPATPGQE